MIATLRALLPHVELEEVQSVDGQPTIRVPADRLLDASRVLRDHAGLGFTLLSEITAVDWWPREPRYEVVYLLGSTTRRLRMKVSLHGHSARVATVQSLWPGAGWLEREVWDMFGIVFEDHGDLRRLLMPEDWEGHPLRKDFPVQIRLKPKHGEALQVTEDEFRANLARDKAARADAPASGPAGPATR